MGGLVKATADTWVSKDADGQLVAVRVVDMDDSHIWRWIHYFRKKWRDNAFVGDDVALDVAIRRSMVTAPAIYAEAVKRGLLQAQAIPPVDTETWRNRFLLKALEENAAVAPALQHLAYNPPPVSQLVITAKTVAQLQTALAFEVWLTEMAARVLPRPAEVVIINRVARSKGATMPARTSTLVVGFRGARQIDLDDE